MDNNVLEYLKKWFSENPNIPESYQKRTLMDIMGVRNLENSWSSIYAFFLNEREEHKLGDLFIRSLLKLMGEEEGWLTPTEIKTEQPTYKDKENNHEKRIDILIKDDIHKRAIIIENKVYHHPVNPFSDYINYAKRIGYEEIRVVILSRHKITDKDENKYHGLQDIEKLTGKKYTSITHKEYMALIEKELPENDNSLYCKILNHFIQNINNITQMTTPEEIIFFLAHFKGIFQIKELFNKVEKNYNDELKRMDLLYNEVRVEKKFHTNDNDSWIYIQYNNYPHLCLTVFLLPNELRTILELRGDKKFMGQQNKTAIKDYVNDYVKTHKKDHSILNTNGLKEDNVFWHIAEYYSKDIKPDDLNPSRIGKTLEENVIDSPIYNLGLEIGKKFLK